MNIEVEGSYTFNIQFKILDNFFDFSNELASFEVGKYGADLTSLTKEQIRTLPLGTKFVFDFNYDLSGKDEYIIFGTPHVDDDNAYFLTHIIGYSSADEVMLEKGYAGGERDVQDYFTDTGGKFEYIYGSNGENWSSDDDTYGFVLQQRVGEGGWDDIENVPYKLAGFCRVYKPTDPGYYDSEIGTSLTAGYLDWTNGVNAADNGLSSVHFNWDSYYSKFQCKTGEDKTVNGNYFLRYSIDDTNYIDFYWNLGLEDNVFSYSQGAFSMRIHLPTYNTYNRIEDLLYEISYGEDSSFGGHFAYELGDWGEPINGTFKIMQYTSYTDESIVVTAVYTPDWSGADWTGDGKTSDPFDTGFVTLVK